MAHLLDAALNAGLQLHQPLLHLAPCLGSADDLSQANHLTFTGAHCHHLQVITKVQGVDALKALLEVRLNPTMSENSCGARLHSNNTL